MASAVASVTMLTIKGAVQSQTEVALTAEIAAVLYFAPQSLDAVWVDVPWLQEALAPAMPTQSSLQAVSCVAVASA